MSNAKQLTADHRKLIITWVGVLGLVSFICGTVLIYKGYHGDLLIGGGLAAISGLVGYLSAGKPTQPQPDITISGDPLKAEVIQPEQAKPI